jgi:atlastin
MKVAIVSVVGAFRTGKSFVLDLFLRYLRYSGVGRQMKEGYTTSAWKKWILAGVDGTGNVHLEGNSNMEQTNGEKGFSWRAGRKRNTTGIWMWEEPFVRKGENGEDIAIFLIDTQGMFDSETSQMLTASIFGLSTLLSSYQIYNVDKRVQEDNLQHLALFTEYGRMALEGKSEEEGHEKKIQRSISGMTSKTYGSSKKEDDEPLHRPFQRLDFLVRDWQDFTRNQTLAEKKQDMELYTKELLSSRTQKDLADTREQINACFEHVECFLLPHPGHAVTEREYDGSVSAIDDRFLELLTVYLDEIFDPKNVVPKKIHGVAVTSHELSTYIKVYAGLFREAAIFPEAKTLLEATAEANNVNMKEKALLKYKKEMEKVAGSKCKFIPIQELEDHHMLCFEGAMVVFDQGAKMGRQSQILSYRVSLIEEIEKERQRFFELNSERDPYKNLEFYLIPGIIAIALLVFRIGQDLMCYDHIGYDIPLYDCKYVDYVVY